MKTPTVRVRHKKTKRVLKVDVIEWARYHGTGKWGAYELVGEERGDTTAEDMLRQEAEWDGEKLRKERQDRQRNRIPDLTGAVAEVSKDHPVNQDPLDAAFAGVTTKKTAKKKTTKKTSRRRADAEDDK